MTRGRVAEAILNTLINSRLQYSFFPKDEQWGNDLGSERTDSRRVKHDAPVPLVVAQTLLEDLSLSGIISLRLGEELAREELHDRLRNTVTDEELAAVREVAGFDWTVSPSFDSGTIQELTGKLEGFITQGVDARTRAIEGNTRLAYYFSRRQFTDSRPVEEKVGDAAVGLVRGVEMYDPRLGFTFSTYAEYHIKKSLQVGALQRVGVPQHYARSYKEIVNTRSRLEAELGRTPTDEEIANVLGLKHAQTVRDRITRYEDLVRANNENSEVDREGNVLQLFSGTEEPGYTRVNQKIDLIRLFESAGLTEKQKEVLVKHFLGELTIDEIATAAGVSKQTISKKITTALEKLKKAAKKWDEY